MRRYLFIACFFLPGTAMAADVSVSGKVTAREGDSSVSVVFSNDDRSTVEHYYRKNREHENDRDDGRKYRGERDDDRKYQGERDDDRHGEHEGHDRGRRKGMPPGLAKRDSLPPGLARHDRLPDDVKYEPLPRDLEQQLPQLPSKDYVRVRVGTDLLILNKKTHVVLDVAKGLGQ
jgi:hypothetical protein